MIHTLNTTRSAAPGLCLRWPHSAPSQGTLINIASILCAACATGQRRLQRQQSVGAELYPRFQEELPTQRRVRIQAVLPAATATDLCPPSRRRSTRPAGRIGGDGDDGRSGGRGAGSLDQGENITLPPVHDLALWTISTGRGLALLFGSAHRPTSAALSPGLTFEQVAVPGSSHSASGWKRCASTAQGQLSDIQRGGISG